MTVNSESGRNGNDAGARLVVDDHLVGVAQHLLHGLDEDALAGDVGRLLVLLVDLDEAVGLAAWPGR